MVAERRNISADYSWVSRVNRRFEETGLVIPVNQRKVYESISLHWGHGKTIIDIGIGVGVGTNILSWNSRFAWGVDINWESIDYAKAMFKRPNLDFDHYDIENPPTREVAKFEIIIASEIIEHLEDPEAGLQNLKRFFLPNSIGFITLPNINNEDVRTRDANNPLHLTRWSAGQGYEFMTKHFRSVTMYDAEKLSVWGQEETIDGDSTCPLVVYKVEFPI